MKSSTRDAYNREDILLILVNNQEQFCVGGLIFGSVILLHLELIQLRPPVGTWDTTLESYCIAQALEGTRRIVGFATHVCAESEY